MTTMRDTFFRCVSRGALFYFYRKDDFMKQEVLKTEVAKRMRFFRKLKGVSAKQMSLDLGKAESYISKIENQQTLPSVDSFADIVRYIGITCDLFFEAQI